MFEYHLRNRMFACMRERKMRGVGARLVKQFLDQAVKDQKRRARFARTDFDILPGNPATPAGLQSFKRRFFCGKAGGIMLCGHRAAAVAIDPLGVSKNALGKSRGTRQHFANARDFDNVYANGNNHRS